MSVSRNILFGVSPVNDAPVFSGARNVLEAGEDAPPQTITFNVTDIETAAASLTLTVVSNSNLPLASAPTLGGVGEVRTLTVATPLNPKEILRLCRRTPEV